MKEVYELWSFCIHSLHLTVPALADLVDPVDPAVLVDLADLVDLVDLVVLVVLHRWDPQSPVRHRNLRTLAM